VVEPAETKSKRRLHKNFNFTLNLPFDFAQGGVVFYKKATSRLPADRFVF
jgi:hypothetical protein